MTSTTEGLYRPLDGGWVRPSDLTRGGWDDRGQHGGPPCGLLASAIAAVPTPSPMQLVRLTFDLYRAVPVDEDIRVSAEVVRAGRRVQVVVARLHTADRDLAMATGLAIRTTEIQPEPKHTADWSSPPPPEASSSAGALTGFMGENTGLRRFHRDAVEIRTVAGSFSEIGPATTWFRLKVSLLEGHPLDPLTRLTTLADLANGNGHILEPASWLFVNPDLSLAMFRYPRGEWVGLKSESQVGGHGIGMVDTTVFDREGAIGRITQSQLVQPRT